MSFSYQGFSNNVWSRAPGANKEKVTQTDNMLIKCFKLACHWRRKCSDSITKGSASRCHCKYLIQTVTQNCFITFLEWVQAMRCLAVYEYRERRCQRHYHKELFVCVCLEFVQADKSLLHVNHFNETTCQCGKSDLKFIQSQDSQTDQRDQLNSRHSGSGGYPVTVFTLVM